MRALVVGIIVWAAITAWPAMERTMGAEWRHQIGVVFVVSVIALVVVAVRRRRG